MKSTLTISALLLALILALIPSQTLIAAKVHILFDETRLLKRSEGSYTEGAGYELAIGETASYGASHFADLLREQGFIVEALTEGPITRENLAETDIFVMLQPSPSHYYSRSEIGVIDEFVRKGGGLFLSPLAWKGHDSPMGGTDRIARAFGVSFKGNGMVNDPTDHANDYLYVVKISSMEDHPITRGVSAYYSQGTYLDEIGRALVLAKSDADSWFNLVAGDRNDNEKEPDEESGPFPVLAAMQYGAGRVVFTGTPFSLVANSWIDHLDAERLALNIVDWLAEDWAVPSNPYLPAGAQVRIGGGEVHDIAYSPDGTLLVVAAQYGVWLIDSESFSQLARLDTKGAPALFLAFSPNGKTIAVGMGDGNIDLWNPRTRDHLGTLFHGAKVTSLAFSKEGTILASGGDDGSIALWNVKEPSLNKIFAGHASPVLSLDFSPAEEQLLSGGADGKAKVWNLDGEQLHTFNHSGEVHARFAEGGWQVITAAGDGKILLWDLYTEKVFTTLTEHDGPVQGIMFVDEQLISWGEDGKILQWDLDARNFELALKLEQGPDKVALSQDGSGLVCLDSTQRLTHWSQRSGGISSFRKLASWLLLRTLTGHSSSVYSVAFSPDGQTLASGSRDEVIKLWEVASGKLLRTLTGHTESVESVAFSPDGNNLASGSYDNTIKLWEVASGKLLETFTGHTSNVNSVAFSPDGNTLASGSSDRTIKLWDVASGKLLRTLTGHSSSVYSVAFSPDGTTVASGSWDQTIKLWDVASGKLLRSLTGHSSSVYSVAFSPDGNNLASGSWDDTIMLWEVASGKLLRRLSGFEPSYRVKAVAFSPDGKTLASGAGNDTIRLWEVASGKLLRTLTGHTSNVNSVAFSPDGTTLASGSSSSDDTIKLWRLFDEERTVVWPAGGIQAVALPRQGNLIALSDPTGWVGLWDVRSGAYYGSFHQQADFLCLSDNGRLLACAHGKKVAVWDTTTKELVSTLSGHSDSIEALEFSPGGELLATASADDTVCLWNPHTGESIATLSGHDGDIVSISFSPDGRSIAVGSSDWTASIWDTSGNRLHTLSGHTGPIYGVSFIAGGDAVVTLSEDGTARFWNAGTGGLLSVKEAPHKPGEFAFSPDGHTLAMATPDGLELWDVQGAKSHGVRSGHYGAVSALALSGDYVVSGGADGTAIVWSTTSALNSSPSAIFSPSTTHVLIDQQVSFDASASSDPDGTIVNYTWDFGDGTRSEGKVVTHTYATAGTYTAKLTVTDNDGQSATIDKEVKVFKHGGTGGPA